MKMSIKHLLLLLLLLGLPAVVQAQDAYSTNADGSIYTYSTNTDGSANIVAYAGPPWVVTIPTNINGLTVTTIGTNTFCDSTSLTSVTIPNSVTSIGVQAFAGCTSLTNATIESGVTSIGADAFALCTFLTSVTIPNSVTSIGEAAFYECNSLTSVTIPGSVTSIGSYAFEFCTSLTAITVDTNNPAYSSLNGVLFDKSQATLITYPDGLGGSYTIPNSATSIGAYAFDSTSLTSVTIGTNVTSIGSYAFEFCSSLTNVTISASVTSIGTAAFESCYSLTNVTIPNSVTSIGDYAFEDDGLTGVTIPDSVTSIGEVPFDYCHSMTAITVDTNNPAFSSLNGVLFDKSQTTLLEYPGGLVGSYTIPNSGTSIGTRAFEYCYYLTNVTIPNSVTSIGNDAFFYCADLTSVTIPNSVISIGSGAFGDCTSLTSVTIGNSVTNIGSGAFSGCTSLSRVYFTGNAPSPTNDRSVFSRDYPATVYFLGGTTGWGPLFDGRPTAPWFLPPPQILTNGPGFGVQPGGFGFTISWATNASVVLEAATNLANPVWIPVSTNTLAGSASHFSDPQWTNYSARYYRLQMP